MEKCFEILGLEETTDIEQILLAYERKQALYSGSVREEDPKYAKRKQKELAAAYQEACGLAAKAAAGEREENPAEPEPQFKDDPELYLRKLYHHYLVVTGKRQPPMNQKRRKATKADARYIVHIMLFWGAVIVGIVAVGWLL